MNHDQYRILSEIKNLLEEYQKKQKKYIEQIEEILLAQ